jgi:hypothetical protein
MSQSLASIHLDGTASARKRVTASRSQRKAVESTRTVPSWRPYVLNRVRQTIRTLTAASGRWCYQFVLLAGIRPAISNADGYAVLAVVVMAAVVVAIVILVAVFAAKPSRRRDALAVLDRILRWKT